MNVSFQLITLLPGTLLSTQMFLHPATHRSENTITEFNTLGERCSGTSFVDALLRANFPTIKRSQRFAHKHFFPWFDLTNTHEQVLDPWKIDEKEFLSDSETNLFVFVIRNHQDWLRSFFLQPFYIPPSHLKHGFLHFINCEWEIDLKVLSRDYYKTNLPEGWTFAWPYELSSQYYDSNVYTGKPFANILELRSYKTRNYLQIGSLVKNFILLRYEDVRLDPEGCINFISEFFEIPKRVPFAPILKYKGVESFEVYQQKNYTPLPSYIEVFIEKYHDCELERQLGFF